MPSNLLRTPGALSAARTFLMMFAAEFLSPVNRAIRLLHRRAQAASRVGHGLGERFRPPASGLNFTRLDPRDRFKHAAESGFSDWAAI